MSVRILLVDDHRMVREGLRALLASESGFDVVGEAADGRTAIGMMRALAPDVVVMDIEMPDMNGIEATRQIKSEYDRTKVVALSTHFDRRFVTHMLDAGASAYVPKMEAHDELIRAVRAVSQGRTYLSPEIAGFVVERFTHEKEGEGGSAFSRLSAREREVLQHTVEGRTIAETAERLQLSPKSVETYRSRLMSKLEIEDIPALVKFAIRHGITTVN
jgi:DNA-binding NarL/FixJ family response regulator